MSSHDADGLQRWERLLDKLPVAAYTCDPDGLIIYFNEHALRLWGRAPKLRDVSERFCGSFRLFATDGTPIGHDECWMALALRHRKEYLGSEVIVQQPEGARRAVLAHANPVFDDDGKLLGAINILVDITDHKRSDEALKEADRRKDEFLAVLSHELRNPLAPLRNGLQVLRRAGGNAAIIEQTREMMDRQLGHMIRLIDDLLDLNRITRNRLELRKQTIQLSDVIQSAMEAARPAIDDTAQQLTVSVPAEPIHLYGDLTRLAQVLCNLLTNSAKYTPPGGIIALRADLRGSEVALTVKDNGIGIPPADLPRIFEMFSKVHRTMEQTGSGLGIGLALVRGLVEMHAGTVQAQSDGPGKGSVFTVRLPVVSSAGTAMPQPAATDSASSLKSAVRRRILVVDDSWDAANSLAMLLELGGNEVRTAYDGVEAIEAAESFRPDVILMDVGMPKLNGLDAARRIRNLPWSDKVLLIALTGWGQDENRRRSRAAGFDYHLTKPVNPQELEALLGSPRPLPVQG
ncbi:MAG: ATP-binding protein [Gemmataceae bacterium]|nr:ATP-binding protein [Gemmataceae bacterium]MCI0738489.1 ATP-binding protein [Gemmataceae bacterium]